MLTTVGASEKNKEWQIRVNDSKSCESHRNSAEETKAKIRKIFNDDGKIKATIKTGKANKKI